MITHGSRANSCRSAHVLPCAVVMRLQEFLAMKGFAWPFSSGSDKKKKKSAKKTKKK